MLAQQWNYHHKMGTYSCAYERKKRKKILIIIITIKKRHFEMYEVREKCMKSFLVLF